MDIKNNILKNQKDEKVFPMTTLDQVIDKKTGKPVDDNFYELLEKGRIAYEISKGNKIYTTFEEIGITDGSETISEIAKNLPANSSLIYHKTSSTGNDKNYPKRTGLLQVVKGNNATRVSFKFESHENYAVGFYDFLVSTSESSRWSDWYNIKEVKSFSNFESIGLKNGSETVELIAKKMPKNSNLQVLISGNYGDTSIYPHHSGMLTVVKGSFEGRCSFKLVNETNFHVGYYNDYYNDERKFKWEKVWGV